MAKKLHPENWLKHYRAQRKLTQPRLSEMSGVSREMIGYIERREKAMTLETSKKLADALGVHYSELIDGPSDAIIARTAAQKEVIKMMAGMSDQAQQAFATGLLSGLSVQKPEEKSKIQKGKN